MSGKRGKKNIEEPQIQSGTFIFPNGDKYDGEYVKTPNRGIIRQGRGKHIGVDGVEYDGEWANDCLNGLGSVTFGSTGSCYTGSFRDNLYNGGGVYNFGNGFTFEGQFEENKIVGSGKLTDGLGQVWIGDFNFRVAHGLRLEFDLEN